MTDKRLYIAAISAARRTGIITNCPSLPAAGEYSSEEEARASFLADAWDIWPPAAGWQQHGVSLALLPEQWQPTK